MKKKAKINKRRLSQIFLLALSGYLFFQFIHVKIDLINYEKEITNYEHAIVEQKVSNEELESLLEKGDDLDYIDYVAREQLDMAYPGERVYYDTSDDEDEE